MYEARRDSLQAGRNSAKGVGTPDFERQFHAATAKLKPCEDSVRAWRHKRTTPTTGLTRNMPASGSRTDRSRTFPDRSQKALVMVVTLCADFRFSERPCLLIAWLNVVSRRA